MRTFYTLVFTLLLTSSPLLAQQHPDLLWSATGGHLIEFSSDGKYIFAQRNKHLVLLDKATGKDHDTVYTAKEDFGYSYDISPDNTLFAVKDSSQYLIWSISERKIIRTIPEVFKPIERVKFSPDSRKLVIAFSNLGMYDIEQGKLLWNKPIRFVSDLQFLASSEHIYTFYYDDELKTAQGKILNINSGDYLQPTDRRKYSPSGNIFVDGNKSVFNAVTGEKLASISLADDLNYQPITLSPKGKYILFSADDVKNNQKVLKLWDIIADREVKTYKAMIYSDMNAAFSQDSQYLAIATRYQTSLYLFSEATSVEEEIAADFSLTAMPNPASTQSLITFSLLKESDIKLSVFDANSREVTQLFSGWATAGKNEFRWDTENMPQGTYFIRLETEGKSAQVQCAIVR
jgi:hypothetical protein